MYVKKRSAFQPNSENILTSSCSHPGKTTRVPTISCWKEDNLPSTFLTELTKLHTGPFSLYPRFGRSVSKVVMGLWTNMHFFTCNHVTKNQNMKYIEHEHSKGKKGSTKIIQFTAILYRYIESWSGFGHFRNRNDRYGPKESQLKGPEGWWITLLHVKLIMSNLNVGPGTSCVSFIQRCNTLWSLWWFPTHKKEQHHLGNHAKFVSGRGTISITPICCSRVTIYTQFGGWNQTHVNKIV